MLKDYIVIWNYQYRFSLMCLTLRQKSILYKILNRKISRLNWMLKEMKDQVLNF